MTFGERITYARKQKKMTQSDLGKMVGTSGDIIGKYERYLGQMDEFSEYHGVFRGTIKYIL